MTSATSMGDANKQVWDDTLTRLLDLSTVTVKKNAELESRVTELEIELSAWKLAHANILETAEREKRAHNVQLSTFNRQISTLECFKNQSPLILCVINGDENVFSRSLMVQGQQGGRQAAQALTKAIAEYLTSEEIQVFGRLSFWITIYYNKRNLVESLVENSICTSEQFEAFISGFSQTSPRFSMVDAGFGKGAVVAKVIEHVQTHAHYPQTLRVFLGASGMDGTEYLPAFNTMEQDQLLGKFVFIRNHQNEIAPEIRHFGVSSLETTDLFIKEKFNASPRRPQPHPLNMSSSTVKSHGGLISPQSESQYSPTNNGFKPIDITKPLHKQTPPPCNEYYLMSCSKGSACKYSHDWCLNNEQLITLAKNAKKAPCNFYKNGMECPNQASCCWGHVCPNGSKCFHYTKGKCWFKGANMHPEET